MTETDFGTCCCCGGAEDVRNVITLHKRSPYGYGWGCYQCGLPPEGAIAVVCDECLEAEAPIREVIKGSARDGARVPYEELDGWEDFEHDLTKHPELKAPQALDDPWEAIDYDDPVVLYDPETGPITDSQLTAITDRLSATNPADLPPYWRNETSGQLQPAVYAFVEHGANPERFPPPTQQQVSYLIQYFQMYINAPCWQGDERLAELRQAAQTLQTAEDCDRWLIAALNLGIDPL